MATHSSISSQNDWNLQLTSGMMKVNEWFKVFSIFICDNDDIINVFQVGMRLKKKSQEAKVEVRKKSQEEDQVLNVDWKSLDHHTTKFSCIPNWCKIQSICFTEYRKFGDCEASLDVRWRRGEGIRRWEWRWKFFDQFS